MTNKRSALTLAEHRALGAELHRMSLTVSRGMVRVCEAYGVTKSRLALARADKALKALQALRSEMERHMFEDAYAWPENDQRIILRPQGSDDLHVYYPAVTPPALDAAG